MGLLWRQALVGAEISVDQLSLWTNSTQPLVYSISVLFHFMYLI